MIWHLIWNLGNNIYPLIILNHMLVSLLFLIAGLLCFWLFFKSIDFFEKI